MKGSCLCGAVQFVVQSFKPSIANCHCSMCRKFTGAAYGTFAAVKRDDLRWQGGEDNITTYQSSETAERGFCKTCGSSIYYRLKDSEEFEIALGTLEDEPDQSIDANIYCQFRPKWARTDQIKNYPTGRE